MQGRRTCRPCARPPGWLAVKLFLVERRLPTITERELDMLQSALTDASARLSGRGEPVRYVRSTFLPVQGRLLSYFEAMSAEAVRTVNDSALAPFTSLEPAIELPEPSEAPGV